MQEVPQVSVVMAVHNGKAYLRECLDSILAQTFRDFEFIVVDDGSTDGTGELLDEYATRDARLRIVHQPNAGLTPSLNRGLALGRGELIARMDADDVAMPHRFRAQVDHLRAHPGIVLLGAEVVMTNPEGQPLQIRSHPRTHSEIRRRLLMADGAALTHPVVMFRRSALDQTGLYDERFKTTQDLDLFLRLSEVGEAANLPDHLLLWRQHPASVNRTKSATWATVKRLALRKTIDRIGQERYLEELVPEEPPTGAEIDWERIWDGMATQGGFPGTVLRRGLRRLRRGPGRMTGLRFIGRSTLVSVDRLWSKLGRRLGFK